MSQQLSNVTASRSFKQQLKSIVSEIPAWLLILPSLLFFLVFSWQPLLAGMWLSFQDTKGYEGVGFNWFQNYIDVVTNSVFQQTLVNTGLYVFWSVVIGFAIPIIVAIIINELIHMKSFFKFSVFFPTMIPGIAVALLWVIILEPGSGGILNVLLDKFGLGPSDWLQNSRWTIPIIVITMTWRSFGTTVILYLASLQGVNRDLYEAASIDGAGIMKRIWNITIPQISPIISTLLILQIIGVFQVFYEPLTMTEGGPNNASMSLMLQSYFYAFRYFKAGHSMAVGMITFVILLIFTIIYFKVNKKLNSDS